MVDFLSELWRFMRVRKKFWLLPILVMMFLLGGLLAARALHERPSDVGGRAYFVTDGERIDAMEWFRPLVVGLGHPFPRVRVPGALMLRVATGLEAAHRLGAPVPTITRRSIRNLTEGAHFSIERARRELGYEPRFRREHLGELLPELQRYHDSLRGGAK